jgi:hypothetical protein
MIVMLSMSFSDKFGPLREVISCRCQSEWWSTYGKWPTQLFNGVRMANTILVLGPGSEHYSTRHGIFGSSDRSRLFQTIEFYPYSRAGSEKPIRGGITESFLRVLDSLPAPSGRLKADGLFIRPTGQYWYPLLFAAPPVLDQYGEIIEEQDSRCRRVPLRESEDWLIASAALAGKVSYAWWSAVGDDFHCNVGEADIARKLAHSVNPTRTLELLAREVVSAGKAQAFVSKNNDGYINVRWLDARYATDKFDRALLEAADMLEYWRPLNIWYRQCMRQTRANLNSRLLIPAEIDRFLRW